MKTQQASELTSGAFVYLPTFQGASFEGREYQGPVMVEKNPDVPGSVLINYPGGTSEVDATDEMQVLPRPKFSGALVMGTDPLTLLTRCVDRLIQAGWPQMAREQFVEHAQKGGAEHLIYTIRDVFEVAA